MDDALAWAQHQRDEAAGLNAPRTDQSWDVATAPFRCSYIGKEEDYPEGYGQYYNERIYTAEGAANDVTKELVLLLGKSIDWDADMVDSVLDGCGGDLKAAAAKLKEAGATAGLLPQARPLLAVYRRRNPHAADAAPCTGGVRACCASSASAAKPVRRHVTTRTARREFYTLAETCGTDPEELEWLEAQSKLEEEYYEAAADDGGSGKSFLCESCHQTWQHAAAQEAHAAAQAELEFKRELANEDY